MNEEYIERIVQKVINHGWNATRYLVPIGDRASAVKIANRLRGMGYLVETNPSRMYSPITFLTVTRQVKSTR